MIKYILIPCFILIYSCAPNKSITGKYRSNFADMGFFVTELEFKPSNRVHYKFYGDLIDEEFDGVYQIIDKTIYLKFDEPVPSKKSDDTSANIYLNSFDKLPFKTQTENGLDFHLKYKIGKDKLMIYRVDNGKLVTKAKYYGTTTSIKNYYLKKIAN